MRSQRLITDGRQPDVLDKIRSHYLEGRKLSEKQELKRKQYEQAHTFRINGYSKEQTVQLLQEIGIVGSIAEAYRVCNCAERLFGDVNQSNKEGLRYILTENFMAIYRKARKDDNLKEANRALENVAKINNLFDPNQAPIDWSKIIIPIPVYTSDPNVLKGPVTEDGEYEEID
jgi:hypothetical protein